MQGDVPSLVDAHGDVLVDTTGWATGIAVSANGTTIYFGDEMGSVWSVAPTGFELTQLATPAARLTAVSAATLVSEQKEVGASVLDAGRLPYMYMYRPALAVLTPFHIIQVGVHVN